MFATTAAPAILALAGVAWALPSSVPMALFESVSSAPAGWNLNGAAAKDEVMNLRIHLAKQNVAEFQDLAVKVCNLSIHHDLLGNLMHIKSYSR